MKQRAYRTLILCVLLLSLTGPAHAAGMTEYALDELGMTVSMPSDYIVFSRDIDADDPNLAAFGLTKGGMSSLMNEQNIYLNGWNADIDHEIVVTMVDSPFSDFNLYSDTVLLAMATSFTSAYEDMGATVIKSELYQHPQAKFLKIYTSRPKEGSTIYALQFSTVYADKAINITLHSFIGPITASQEAVMKSIVDSAGFDTPPQTAQTDHSPTDAFTYTDTKSKATFVVPANWVETPLSGERQEFIDAKFTSLEDDGTIILYGSFDLWDEMPASERSGSSRSDLDNSTLTKFDIADILGIAANEVRSVTYGEMEYYTAAVASAGDVYGIGFTVTATHVICVENGYLHYFLFSGESGHKLYGDFESLLNSVDFPQPANTGYSNTYPGTYSGAYPGTYSDTSSDLTRRFTPANMLISLIVTLAVYSLPIIIFRYAIRKEPVEKKKAKKITIIYGICAFIVMSVIVSAINGSGAAGGAILLWSGINYRVLTSGEVKAAPNGPHEKVCHNCGAAVPAESKYCHKCGAQLSRSNASDLHP